MTINRARVKRGMYADSITLMRVARALHAMEGVEEAAALMATPANLELLAEAGLAYDRSATGEPGSSDVLIVVRARDEESAEAALTEAEARLLRHTQRSEGARGEGDTVRQPRSLEEAARQKPQATVAVISVPGMYAALEAQQALRAGLHVFLFSDNLALEDEVALKRMGTERGLLVMGPDCGTARLNGVGLGFVNAVPDGPVGIVGASGTGMQQVMCLLAQAGHGISQAIGCGGRDLSLEVGGLTALQGLRLLQEDADTRVIVLISKPPAPQVAEKVLTAAAQGTRPVVAVFLGADPTSWQGRYGEHVHIVQTLSEAAQLAGALCKNDRAQLPAKVVQTRLPADSQPPAMRGSGHPSAGQPPYLAALFSGGTLCDEALHIWGEQLGPVYSNIPLNPAWRWQAGPLRQGHSALDLGADEYTRGRPHPMIDPEARLHYLREAANDPLVGLILLDIVLGYCAHPDPAAIYAPAIHEGRQQARQAGRRLRYVVSLCGTEDDPQSLSRQQARLKTAGAEVYTDNAQAALRCLDILTQPET